MTMNSIVWIFLLATWPMFECTENKMALRIFDGFRQNAVRYPFIVAMVDNYKHFLIRVCTGTLLKADSVLTAGHCLSERLQFVQYGEMILSPSRTKKKRRITEKIVHPNYLKTNNHLWLHDIGLVRIFPVEMKMYGELVSPNYLLSTSHEVVLVGYGKNTRGNITFEQKNTQPLLAGDGILTECHDEVTRKIPSGLLKHYLCVTPKPYNFIQHIMSGDAGGPLLYDGKVVGVASQVYLRKAISVYTSVIQHFNWINKVAFHERPKNPTPLRFE